jgi:hypothetical protein
VTPTFDGTVNDPTIRPALGDPPTQAAIDELDELTDVLDKLAPEAELVLDGGDGFVTVSELRDFNRDNVRYPSALRSPFSG